MKLKKAIKIAKQWPDDQFFVKKVDSDVWLRLNSEYLEDHDDIILEVIKFDCVFPYTHLSGHKIIRVGPPTPEGDIFNKVNGYSISDREMYKSLWQLYIVQKVYWTMNLVPWEHYNEV